MFTQTYILECSTAELAMHNGQKKKKNTLKTTQMDEQWYINTMEYNLELRIKSQPLYAT